MTTLQMFPYLKHIYREKPMSDSRVTKEAIAEKIYEIIGLNCSVKVDAKRNNEDLMTDLGLDDLDMVELIMDCEDEFTVLIPEEVAINIKTLGNLIDECWNRVQQRL